MTEKYNMPDERGHFGPYGGIFVAETLIPPIQELNAAYHQYLKDFMEGDLSLPDIDHIKIF